MTRLTEAVTAMPRTARGSFLEEKFARLALDLKAEAHVVHSSIDAEHEHIDALEYSIDKRIKGIEEALRNGRLSLTDLELAMEEQRNQFEEDISDKTRSFEKLLENALKREIGDLEKRMAEKMKLLKENKTLVVEDEKRKNGSGFPKELRRLEGKEKSQYKAAVENHQSAFQKGVKFGFPHQNFSGCKVLNFPNDNYKHTRVKLVVIGGKR